MELPKYEMSFDSTEKAEELSDFSFETNANLLLEKYYKFLPSLKEHLKNIDRLTPLELINYNDNVAQILYGPRILELFRNNQHGEITHLSEIIKERLLRPKREIVELVDFDQLAQLVIRPEARFVTEDIKSFLEKEGYEIVLEFPLVVNLQQYWVMYNEGFIKSNLYDFPTRTLVYTQGESKILILHKKQNNLQNHLHTNLKGTAGVHSSKPTLRGSVILDRFEKALEENERLFCDSIDPLGMYRAITSGNIPSADPYNKCDKPIFYYAGQGIHLPTDDELTTNAGILLNPLQLEELSKRFRKR